jgi:hypothetical protein
MPEKHACHEQLRIMHMTFGSDPLSLLPIQVVVTGVGVLSLVSDADMQARWVSLWYDCRDDVAMTRTKHATRGTSATC